MNARQEFLEHTRNKQVLCAEIGKGIYWANPEYLWKLTVNHTQEDLHKFLNFLDFDYDCGFGGQNLFGTIWYTDSTWSSRGEYDGSEWWNYNECPEIPESLND